MTTKEALIAARKLIELPENWIKRSSKQGDSYCATGAVYKAYGYDFTTYGTLFTNIDEKTVAINALCAQVPWIVKRIVSYNDAPTTTHQDILDLFDRAIKECE